jgi:hypothetical protein
MFCCEGTQQGPVKVRAGRGQRSAGVAAGEAIVKVAIITLETIVEHML